MECDRGCGSVIVVFELFFTVILKKYAGQLFDQMSHCCGGNTLDADLVGWCSDLIIGPFRF